MKKKGFTLIELLGGIVILSIIALITIPVITGVINKARLQTLKNSAYGMLDATNLYYAQVEPTKNLRFDIEDNTMTSSDTTKLISYKGIIKAGSVILNKNGKVTICITDGKNSAYKNPNESKVTLVEKDTCYIPNNNSIVYLEDSGATENDASNQQLLSRIEALETQMETVATIANSSTLDKVYPVGSIYITATEDTVAKVQAKFGGTWQAYGAGRTLVGVDTNQEEFDTNEETGGEKTHTLTVDEMPKHMHHVVSFQTQSGSYKNYYPYNYIIQHGSVGTEIKQSVSAFNNLNAWGTGQTDEIGSSHAHNNLQPYITVYMYKRTA